jgi:transcriptional regulator
VIRANRSTNCWTREWQDFLRANNFGQVIAPGRGRALPVVTPVHFAMADEATAVLHVQRANPLLEALGENPVCMLAVIGSYVYIPTDWNAGPEEDARWGVPTSYYAAVQAACEAEIVDDGEGIAAILNQLLAQFESAGSEHFDVEPGSPYETVSDS